MRFRVIFLQTQSRIRSPHGSFHANQCPKPHLPSAPVAQISLTKPHSSAQNGREQDEHAGKHVEHVPKHPKSSWEKRMAGV